MQHVLEELGDKVGVIGSILVGEDGVVVASAMSATLDEDRVAALANTVILSARLALEQNGIRGLRSLVLLADYGKVFLQDIGIGFLVVVTQKDISLGSAEIEVKSAARKLVQMARLSV